MDEIFVIGLPNQEKAHTVRDAIDCWQAFVVVGTRDGRAESGFTDADGNLRVQDVVVDIGVYEGVAAFFRDGFEAGDTSELDSVVS